MTPNPITLATIRLNLLAFNCQPSPVGRVTPAANDAPPAARRPAAGRARVISSTVATVAEYREALAAHPWHFEHEQDHRTWAAGTNSLGRLQAMRKRLDRDGAIWDEYAPEGYRVGELAGAQA